VIRNPTVTAGLKWTIEIFPNAYTLIATPINGAIAMNGTPNSYIRNISTHGIE